MRACASACAGWINMKTNITIIQEHGRRHKVLPRPSAGPRPGPRPRVFLTHVCSRRQTGNLTSHSYLSVRLNLRKKREKETKKERRIFSPSPRLCGLVKGSASVTRSRRQRRCLSLPLTKGCAAVAPRASHKPDRRLTPL